MTSAASSVRNCSNIIVQTSSRSSAPLKYSSDPSVMPPVNPTKATNIKDANRNTAWMPSVGLKLHQNRREELWKPCRMTNPRKSPPHKFRKFKCLVINQQLQLPTAATVNKIKPSKSTLFRKNPAVKSGFLMQWSDKEPFYSNDGRTGYMSSGTGSLCVKQSKDSINPGFRGS